MSHVLPGTTVNIDEFGRYKDLAECGFRHVAVNPKANEHTSRDSADVNAIEGFWAQLKRGISGTHIHVSGKRLPKYLGEFEYRWNMHQVPHLMLDHLTFSLRARGLARRHCG